MKTRKLVKADRERRIFFIRIVTISQFRFEGELASIIRPSSLGRMQDCALPPRGRPVQVLGTPVLEEAGGENHRGAPLTESPATSSISTRAVCCEITVNGRLSVATRFSTRVLSSRR